MSDACFHTEDAACPNCAPLRFQCIPGDFSLGEYADARTIARQARTIRRLRALADGYREHAKAWRYYTRGLVNGARTWMLKDKEAGMQEERARIVAALGASVWTGSLYPPEVHAAVQSIRDAIERGEL